MEYEYNANEFTPEQALANAIVEQAVDDYRRAAKKFHKYDGIIKERVRYVEELRKVCKSRKATPKQKYKANLHIGRTNKYIGAKRVNLSSANDVIRSCEKFFASEWYQVLTKLDGDFLVRRLRDECKLAN